VRGIDVLFLCTGNICRSPMAEALLRHQLAERSVDAHVHSAGLRLVGEPASANGVDVMADRGLDMTSHRSRIVNRELLEEADLVLAMAREHLREAVVALPDVWARAFTLKELVRRGETIGARAPGESLEAWLARAHSGRNRTDLMGSSDDDDVADPIGSGRSSYERTAAELGALVDRLLTLAWPTAAEETA
jgi:protein-tyrosine phosphatase